MIGWNGVHTVVFALSMRPAKAMSCELSKVGCISPQTPVFSKGTRALSSLAPKINRSFLWGGDILLNTQIFFFIVNDAFGLFGLIVP